MVEFDPPGPSVGKLDAPSIAGDMLWPLLVMVLGYQLLFFGLLTIGVRAQVLGREKHSRWVADLLTNSSGDSANTGSRT